MSQCLQEARERVEEAFSLFPKFGCDLLEICCGVESTLSKCVLDHGSVAYRVGLSNKMDLTTHAGLERASEFARLVRPRWIWVSRPCGPTSPIQNINQRTEAQVRNLQ